MAAPPERLPTPAGDGYQPDTDIMWRKGRQAELFTVDLLEALKEGNVEVKNDSRSRDRVFIEYACQWSDGSWHASGVRDTAAESWLFVLRDCIVVAAPVWVLREMTERIIASGQRAGAGWGMVDKPHGQGDQWPTKGVVVPHRNFVPWVLALADMRGSSGG